MTAATEQQTRPLLAHLEAAGYRHHPEGATSDAWEWETGESSFLRVIIWPEVTMVRAYGAQRSPLWTAKFTKATPDSLIVAFLSAEEERMTDG